MKTAEAIQILEKHNLWRRGADDIDMIEPKLIGEAIDTVVNYLKPTTEEEKICVGADNRFVSVDKVISVITEFYQPHGLTRTGNLLIEEIKKINQFTPSAEEDKTGGEVRKVYITVNNPTSVEDWDISSHVGTKTVYLKEVLTSPRQENATTNKNSAEMG